MGRRTYSKLHVPRLIRFHTFTSKHSILAADHLDESMAFVYVDNASLDDAKLAE